MRADIIKERQPTGVLKNEKESYRWRVTGAISDRKQHEQTHGNGKTHGIFGEHGMTPSAGC